MNKYDTWETEVTELIAAQLQCTYGDAAGVVEAQPFYMAQSWGMGLTAEQTANKIIFTTIK